MKIGEVRSGSGVASLIVAGQNGNPPAVKLNLIVAAFGSEFASRIAWRSVLGPESAVLVTVKVEKSLYGDSYAPRSGVLPIVRALPEMSSDGMPSTVWLVPELTAGEA